MRSLSLSEDTDSTDDWLDEHEDALLSSEAFLDGGPLDLLALRLELSLELEFESSFCTGINGEGVSFSSLDLILVFLLIGEPFGLVLDVLLSLLSVSDSELLSGEKMLFFFSEFASILFAFGIVFDIALDFAPVVILGTAGCFLTSTDAAFLDLIDRRLGGIGFGVSGFGTSSSLDEETFAGLWGFGSSFAGSSTGGGTGDLGGGTVAGTSEVDDSESELLDPEPELVDDVPLLLESEVDPELLSVLLLLTWKWDAIYF